MNNCPCQSNKRWSVDATEAIFACILLFFSFSLIQVSYSYECMIVLFCLAIAFIVFLRPVFGIYLFILLYPLDSIYFVVDTSESVKIRLYLETVLATLFLLVMIVRKLSERHRCPEYVPALRSFPVQWILFILALFMVWSLFTVSRSEYFTHSLLGWWRFISCFIVMMFMVLYLDGYDKILKILIFYCCVSVVYALSAIVATHYVFDVKYELFEIVGKGISIEASLFNSSGGAMKQHAGMITGIGLSNKHELSMLLMGGIFFSVFLMKVYRSVQMRCVFAIFLLLYITIIYQVFSRLSIAGMFLVAIFLCVAIPSWRKSMVWVLLALIAVNFAGFGGSQLIRPAHMKNMESTKKKIESVTSKSEFTPSSFAGRKHIWKKTIARIARNGGLGTGPDSLKADMTFISVTGHNLFLTLAAEYGLPGSMLVFLFFMIIACSSYKFIFVRSAVENDLWLLKVVCLGAVSHALFEYSFDLPISQKQLWFMLGLLMATIIMAEKDKRIRKLNYLGIQAGNGI